MAYELATGSIECLDSNYVVPQRFGTEYQELINSCMSEETSNRPTIDTLLQNSNFADVSSLKNTWIEEFKKIKAAN